MNFTLERPNRDPDPCFRDPRFFDTSLDRITGMPSTGLDSLDDVLALDARSRRIAAELCLQKA